MSLKKSEVIEKNRSELQFSVDKDKKGLKENRHPQKVNIDI